MRREKDERHKRKKRAGEKEWRGEKIDVTVQSAPSAQLLRCGLAPSSQSQPDPHIAFIYLWKEEEMGGGEKESGREGASDKGGGRRKGSLLCLLTPSHCQKL